MKVTILGCGSSGGVPLVGCDCKVCTSSNPKNRRMRVSLLVETAGKKILVDTSPDLREQCLRQRILSVDSILYTHAHADHIHGIDDVRSLNYHKNAPIDIYAHAATLEELHARFPYVFSLRTAHYGWYKPALTPHCIMEEALPRTFKAADNAVDITAFPQWHGEMITLGFRIGNFAYSTDLNRLPDVSFACLENLDVWVVDCLRPTPSPTHAHLALTLEWIARVQPKRAILTHMGHEFDYEELRTQLPPGVEPGYDGMVLSLQ